MRVAHHKQYILRIIVLLPFKEQDMQMKKAVMNWSGGKDSAHALWKVMQGKEYDIVALLTTTNSETKLSTMHNIPLHLLEAQSESIGIPLYVVPLKPKGNMSDYSNAMDRAAQHFKAQGVTHFIYGDIFLHDIRSYREAQLTPLGITVVEPLWGASSREIIDAYLETGLQTVIVTTGDNGLGMEAIGQIIDRKWIDHLPADCDPNGENGEYHTFCFDGPIYHHPISFQLGTPVKKSYDIRLDDGTLKTFTYCATDIK